MFCWVLSPPPLIFTLSPQHGFLFSDLFGLLEFLSCRFAFSYAGGGWVRRWHSSFAILRYRKGQKGSGVENPKVYTPSSIFASIHVADTPPLKEREVYFIYRMGLWTVGTKPKKKQ